MTAKKSKFSPKEVLPMRVGAVFRRLLAEQARLQGKTEAEIVEACFMTCYAQEADLTLGHRKARMIDLLSRMDEIIVKGLPEGEEIRLPAKDPVEELAKAQIPLMVRKAKKTLRG